MSKTQQISITLPQELIEAIKRSVERGEARSVSAYIAERLKPGMIIDSLFAEWDLEHGSVPEGDRQWAEAELDRVFPETSKRQVGGAA